MARRGLWKGLLVLALVAMWTGTSAAQASAASTTFSGRATVVDGKVFGIPVTLVDTGDVNASGGDLEANLLCYPSGSNCTIGGLPDVTNGMVNARVLHAAVVARGQASSAEASVAELSLTNVAGNSIDAQFLSAEAEARCTGGAASVSGNADIAELTINGQTIAVTGEANQRVDLDPILGSYVVVNEQVASVSGNRGDITVSALHIVIPGPLPGESDDTNVYVARAHADILCAGPAGGCPGDRVTGGGWYYWPASPNRVHFALAARNGINTWGHLLYMDKAQGVKAKGTPTAAQLTPTPGSRNNGSGTVEGDVSVDRLFGGKQAAYFVVRFQDNGEPGRNDSFAIALLDRKGGETLYSANVSLALSLTGGNLQYHDCK